MEKRGVISEDDTPVDEATTEKQANADKYAHPLDVVTDTAKKCCGGRCKSQGEEPKKE